MKKNWKFKFYLRGVKVLMKYTFHQCQNIPVNVIILGYNTDADEGSANIHLIWFNWLDLFSVPLNFIYNSKAFTYQTTLKEDQRSQRSRGLDVRNGLSTCWCADWLWDLDSAWLLGPLGGLDSVSVSPGSKLTWKWWLLALEEPASASTWVHTGEPTPLDRTSSAPPGQRSPLWRQQSKRMT